MKELLGVVLCGGQSSRMGEDKGLLKIKTEEHWAEKNERLLSFFVPTIFSINDTQLKIYKEHFEEDKLVLDQPLDSINGPLRGILSVHQQYPELDLLILPCDMINCSKKVLERLIDVYSTKKAVEVIAPLVENYLQPLLAIYTSKGLKRVMDLVNNTGALKNRSMIHLLREMKKEEVFFGSEFNNAFRNFNSPGDILK